MNYKKGSFNTVPNKEYLKGKPAEMQSVYFWIVDHANEVGQCFPGRVTLAKEAGCNIKTVDKYLGQLIEEGFISKTQRRKKDSVGLSSNIYQLLLKTVTPELAITENNPSGLPENGAVTIPIELNPIPIVEPKVPDKSPFIFIEELNKLKESTWKIHKIIYLYFVKKEFQYENEAQFKSAIAQNLKAAKLLEGYNATQIEETMDYCEENYKLGWSLYAVGKAISGVVNKKS